MRAPKRVVKPAGSNYLKSMKGAAGVHLVVAQLSLGGYVAMPTTRNLKSIDVVAFNEKLSRFAFIQVKSTDNPRQGWVVRSIQEEDGWERAARRAISPGPHVFYVFVSLPNRAQPDPAYYIVPAADVARSIISGMKRFFSKKRGHRAPCAWGYGGLTQKVAEKYGGKWDMLKLGA